VWQRQRRCLPAFWPQGSGLKRLSSNPVAPSRLLKGLVGCRRAAQFQAERAPDNIQYRIITSAAGRDSNSKLIPLNVITYGASDPSCRILIIGAGAIWPCPCFAESSFLLSALVLQTIGPAALFFIRWPWTKSGCDRTRIGRRSRKKTAETMPRLDVFPSFAP